MLKKRGIWVLVLVLGLVLVGAIVLTAAKPAPNIMLRAYFMDADENEIPYNITNDAKGPYVTGSTGVDVWFTSDVGNLFFEFEHHSGRSLGMIFPYFLSPCGWLPDTAGLYPDLPDEPVDYFKLITRNGPAFGGPRLNFLQMEPNVHKQVRLWTTICTTQQHFFYFNYNNQNPTNISGVVDVIAFESGGKLVRWEITPVPDSGNLAWIYKWPEGNDKDGGCFYTVAPMPFKLILERL